jgi:hypothetical protein
MAGVWWVEEEDVTGVRCVEAEVAGIGCVEAEAEAEVAEAGRVEAKVAGAGRVKVEAEVGGESGRPLGRRIGQEERRSLRPAGPRQAAVTQVRRG